MEPTSIHGRGDHRHPRQPAGARGGARARSSDSAIERIYCGGDLVGYGPWPNEVCGLIEERGIPTIYGNYDYAIGRDDEDCMCAYPNQHDRDLGQLSVDWTLEHTDQRSKDFMRALPFDLRFELGGRRVLPRPRLAPQGQRVPLRGQAGEDVRADRRRRGLRRAGLRAHPQAVDPRRTAASCSSTAARSASRRTAIPAAASRSWKLRPTVCRPESSASTTTPSSPPARSPSPAFPASTPRSCCSRPSREP